MSPRIRCRGSLRKIRAKRAKIVLKFVTPHTATLPGDLAAYYSDCRNEAPAAYI